MGELIEIFLRSGNGQIFPKSEQTGQHPAHIAIHDRHSLTKAQRSNGRRRGRANAWEFLQSRQILRKNAAMRLHDLLGTAVQHAGTAVVTQTTPQAHHLIKVSSGQCLNRWKTLDKPLEIRLDGADLGLLQHDL